MKSYPQVVGYLAEQRAIGLAVTHYPNMLDYPDLSHVEYIYGIPAEQVRRDIENSLTYEMMENARQEVRDITNAGLKAWEEYNKGN